ncbi:hypothetical protein JMN32_05230 [Fulvivirga sp. 29W222]|uniref:Fibronectin type-III domain-containing protein n=1 Tax=Fulvivirga marina TaxID=2494733 RepID=A0A937KD60_9BACT|nr:hypothetical protein [Fulvivirga marina]MBL6445700.1 hypothetical protein [Fulvivirga marina]
MYDIKKTLFITFILTATASFVLAQTQYSGEIKVLSRATGNSVKLRWAPTTYMAWRIGNELGYDVVRYTFDPEGERMLKDSILLTRQPLKPLPLPAWEPLVKNNRYAAITAQALYGESFQMEEGSSGQAALINQNTEQENRFSFALACADQSLEVAKASGLYYEDKTAMPGTEYVYRVKLASQRPGFPVFRGSAIASPSKVDALPRPDSLYAEFGDGSVRIHWNSFFNRMDYNYYIIEKSTDNKIFKKTSELNFLQLIHTSGKKDYNIYYMDSLANDRTYYYRIKGVTAFGKEGPPSNVVQGQAHKKIRSIPGIRKGEIDVSGRANINWYFPGLQTEIKGFYVARGMTGKGPFVNVHDKILPPSTRSYSDNRPMSTNYYVVRAESLYGQVVESMPMLVQSMDTIPPLPPTGITGKIDSTGNVTLMWSENNEPDLHGYKVFRSYHQDKDYVQAHRNTIKANEFNENVQLENLTKDYYYQVVAVDHMSNASAFSAPVLLKKPDIIPPSAPVLRKPKYENGQVMLNWIAGTDEDLAGYRLYRENEGINTLIANLQPDQVTYQDSNMPGGAQYIYKLIALDGAGLNSDTSAYNIVVPDNSILPEVKKITYTIDQEKRKLTLSWKYDLQGIDGYILYRSLDEGTLRTVGRLPADKTKFIENDYKVGRVYKYRIQAYSGNKRSPLSAWIKPTTN